MNAALAPGGRAGVVANAVGIGWRSPHHRELLQTRPALDFIEVHAENHFAPGGAARAVLLAARADYPLSLHAVGLSLGAAAGLDSDHLERLAALVDTVDPVLVSDHASFARVHRPGDGAVVHVNDLLPLPWTRAALDVMAVHVDQVQTRLRRQLLVENLSACVRWRASEMSEAEFFTALVRRTGCGLLVDLNNLVVNAQNAGEADPVAAACAFVDAIPPGSVGEIHLAGHTWAGALCIDDHGSRVPASVHAVLAHAVRRWGPRPTLIEWDTDLPALDVLLDEAARARAVQAGALAGSRRTERVAA